MRPYLSRYAPSRVAMPLSEPRVRSQAAYASPGLDPSAPLQLHQGLSPTLVMCGLRAIYFYLPQRFCELFAVVLRYI
jgi:hypothetical protein